MDLQELKITIRSILISAKHNLTTLELVKDFQVVEGKNLEHILQDLGFRDWDDENLIHTFRDTFVYDRAGLGLFDAICRFMRMRIDAMRRSRIASHRFLFFKKIRFFFASILIFL